MAKPMIQATSKSITFLALDVTPIGDNKRNRRPDLAIIEPTHLTIDSIKTRTALFLGALPPRFVAEVVSPGNADSENYQRDYTWKRQQYQDWGIPEYWIIDPYRAQVTVLCLVKGNYQAKTYQGTTPIRSLEFPQLQVTAAQLLADDVWNDKDLQENKLPGALRLSPTRTLRKLGKFFSCRSLTCDKYAGK